MNRKTQEPRHTTKKKYEFDAPSKPQAGKQHSTRRSVIRSNVSITAVSIMAISIMAINAEGPHDAVNVFVHHAASTRQAHAPRYNLFDQEANAATSKSVLRYSSSLSLCSSSNAVAVQMVLTSAPLLFALTAIFTHTTGAHSATAYPTFP
jgi:hypothetical protein